MAVLRSDINADTDIQRFITAVDGTWTPVDLGASRSAHWHAADHGTANMTDDGAGVISSWADRVGSLALTATLTTRPVWSTTGFNGALPAVTGDGTDDRLSATTFPTIPSGTSASFMAMVVDQKRVYNAATESLVRYGSNGGTAARSLDKTGNLGVNRCRVHGCDAQLADLTVDFTGPHILIGSWNATVEAMRLDGTDKGTQTITSVSTTNTRFSIFASNNTTPSAWSNCGIAELIAGAPLTTLNYQKLEGYWAWYYTLRSLLPSDHPYKTVRP